MRNELILIGAFLVMFGGIVGLVASCIAIRRAFKVNILWGLSCILLPAATLVFPFVSWHSFKGLFYSQLIAIALIALGLGLMFLDPSMRIGLQNAMAQAAQNSEPGDGVPSGGDFLPTLAKLMQHPPTAPEEPEIPEAQPILPQSAPQPPQASATKTPVPAKLLTLAERQRKVNDLYVSVQAWSVRLQAAMPSAGTEPEKVKAFNEETARYQEMLAEYKKESSELVQATRQPRM